jgi:hypothetical protein
MMWIQQRLIAPSLCARAMARRFLGRAAGPRRGAFEGLKEVSDELREVSRMASTRRSSRRQGWTCARALARRSNVPIDADVNLDERPFWRLSRRLLTTSPLEALTNVESTRVLASRLIVANEDGALAIEVRDDGIGGVDAGRGSGILGLTDRVEALGGTISIVSPPHGGTTFSVRLPITT